MAQADPVRAPADDGRPAPRSTGQPPTAPQSDRSAPPATDASAPADRIAGPPADLVAGPPPELTPPADAIAGPPADVIAGRPIDPAAQPDGAINGSSAGVAASGPVDSAVRPDGDAGAENPSPDGLVAEPAAERSASNGVVDGVSADVVASRPIESVARPAGEAVAPDRIFTIPNLLSVLRLLGVPLFLWLLLGPRDDLVALIVLVASGASDWLDGKLARWLNQASRLGALLDPAADRLYIVATLVAFVLRDIIPWWLAVVLIGKDVVVGLCLPLLRRAGYSPPAVHYVGKAATFALLYAFPFLLLAQGDSAAAAIARPIGFAFTAWGTALYVWTGALYVAQALIAVRTPRSGR